MATEVWDPLKISIEKLGKYTAAITKTFDVHWKLIVLEYYTANIKLLWPHSQFRYSEDAALDFLVKHGYDVEMALAELVVDIDALGRTLN